LEVNRSQSSGISRLPGEGFCCARVSSWCSAPLWQFRQWCKCAARTAPGWLRRTAVPVQNHCSMWTSPCIGAPELEFAVCIAW